MWSIGCIMYELLTGKLPFDASNTAKYKQVVTKFEGILTAVEGLPKRPKVMQLVDRQRQAVLRVLCVYLLGFCNCQEDAKDTSGG